MKLKKILLAALLIVLAAAGFFAWQVARSMALLAAQVDFNVAPGSGLRSAARAIAEAGVPVEPWLVVVLGKVLRVEASIKAGSYEVNDGVTAWELMGKLSRGDVQQSEIAFIEGWTFRQMRERLDQRMAEAQRAKRGKSAKP